MMVMTDGAGAEELRLSIQSCCWKLEAGALVTGVERRLVLLEEGASNTAHSDWLCCWVLMENGVMKGQSWHDSWWLTMVVGGERWLVG